jgi:NAD(P)-dependent dehydrogenase (short-subunit alcohol dehydrogenase family)
MSANGKVAVVTGGASGIGLALRTRFAKEGAHVGSAAGRGLLRLLRPERDDHDGVPAAGVDQQP